MCIEVVGQVVSLPDGEDGVALIDIGGSIRRVSLVILRLDDIPVAPGDWLLSHTGLAVAVLEPEHAAEIVAQRRLMAQALDAADRSDRESPNTE